MNRKERRKLRKDKNYKYKGHKFHMIKFNEEKNR